VKRLRLRLDGMNERHCFITVFSTEDDGHNWQNSGSLIFGRDWVEAGPLDGLEPMGGETVEVEVEVSQR